MMRLGFAVHVRRCLCRHPVCQRLQLLVLEDRLPLGDTLGGVLTWSLLGPNSLGGAVNLITRRGAGPVEGELEASGGSYGSASGEGSIGGVSRQGTDYYVAGGYEQEDGWRQATGAKNYNGFFNLGRRGERRGITVQGFGAKSRAETAGSLPESIFRDSPEVNFTVGDFEDLDLLQGNVSGYAPVGPGRGTFTTYLRRSHAERFNVNQAPDDNVRSITTNGTLGGNLDWRWTRPLANGELSLRTGVDAAANRVHVNLIEEDPVVASDRTVTTDVKSPSWAGPPRPTSIPAASATTTSECLSRTSSTPRPTPRAPSAA